MTPYVLLLCAGLVTLAAAETCSTRDVSSWGWRDHEESVNVLQSGAATSMTVVREHYDAPSLCTENKTFRFTETKLWVSGGCRATFTVCYDQSYTFDAKINVMKNEFNAIQTEQQTQIERLEGIVNTLNATVMELGKDEAIDNQDTDFTCPEGQVEFDAGWGRECRTYEQLVSDNFGFYDTDDAPYKCHTREISCLKDDIPRCNGESEKCDEAWDCDDHSDEDGCDFTCPAGQVEFDGQWGPECHPEIETTETQGACKLVTCENEGICSATTVTGTDLSGFKCICKPGFEGELCKIPLP